MELKIIKKNKLKNKSIRFRSSYKIYKFILRGASVCKCASGVQEATHSPSCFVRGALSLRGLGVFAHFVCALCVRILTVGGVGVGGWVGCPRGGWGHSKH